MTCNTRFNELLDNWWHNPNTDNRETLIARAEAEFSEERAVLAMDLCGFSDITETHGPIPFLALIRYMRKSVPPLVEHHNGETVNFHADNAMAHFPDVHSAVQAALAIRKSFTELDFDHEAANHIGVSIGIAFGPIFVLRASGYNSEDGKPLKSDLFGNAVNQAFRLGEDLANYNEILLTPECAASLTEGFKTEEKTLKRGCKEIDFHLLTSDYG